MTPTKIVSPSFTIITARYRNRSIALTVSIGDFAEKKKED